MSCKSLAATALAAVLLGVAPQPRAPVAYSAPAGERPAGADAVHPTTAVLPSGRIASPAGTTLFVGTNPLGMALSPDGRYAVVSNDDERTNSAPPPPASGLPAAGFSLAVVDTATMRLAGTYADPSVAFFVGVACVRDATRPGATLVLASDGAHGVVRVFDLAADGTLTPQSRTIALPAQGTRRPFPAGIAASPDGATAYVADNLGDAVSAIDVASRTIRATYPVGNFPVDVAAAGNRIVVSSGGLSSYAEVAPALAPQFAPPAFDPARSTTLSVLDATGASAALEPAVRMDNPPDGSKNIGGAAPGAIAIRRDGRLAYVALANVDRVAVVSLGPSGAGVVRGLDLRLFPSSPYGAQPSAEVLSKDGKRLYVALAGLNAVAVLDARAPSRYRFGLIPTGWYPSGLALSPNGRYLYVISAKGAGQWGEFTRVDLKHTSLVKATMDTLRYNRTPSAAKENALVPPLRSPHRSTSIEHVVYVAVGAATFDAALGDLTDASGAPADGADPRYVRYGQSVTPNLHALARTYGLATNFYAPDADVGLASTFALASGATFPAQRVARVRSGRGWFATGTADPEDYARSGYLFDALARAGLSFRDYGGLLELSGFAGGRYHLDVPALAALSGNVDAAYDVADPAVGDVQRAREFAADFRRYADQGRAPDFTYVRLPAAAGAAGAADADRALGAIVEFLSHLPVWTSTAIFIVPEGSAGDDHVNALRTFCIVVSPFVRPALRSRTHVSVPSVVKTEEEVLGLPPLTLDDLLATDMAEFFQPSPDAQPYQAIR